MNSISSNFKNFICKKEWLAWDPQSEVFNLNQFIGNDWKHYLHRPHHPDSIRYIQNQMVSSQNIKVHFNINNKWTSFDCRSTLHFVWISTRIQWIHMQHLKCDWNTMNCLLLIKYHCHTQINYVRDKFHLHAMKMLNLILMDILSSEISLRKISLA